MWIDQEEINPSMNILSNNRVSILEEDSAAVVTTIRTNTIPSTTTTTTKKKAQQIELAIRTKDIWLLRSLALSSNGFIHGKSVILRCVCFLFIQGVFSSLFL